MSLEDEIDQGMARACWRLDKARNAEQRLVNFEAHDVVALPDLDDVRTEIRLASDLLARQIARSDFWLRANKPLIERRRIEIRKTYGKLK